MADHDIGRLHMRRGQERVEIVDDLLSGARNRRIVAASEIRAVITAHAGEGGNAQLDRCPHSAVVAIAGFENDRRAAAADAAEKEVAASDVDRTTDDVV